MTNGARWGVGSGGVMVGASATVPLTVVVDAIFAMIWQGNGEDHGSVMYLFFIGMLGTAIAVPQRVDSEPVSTWVTTRGLLDDRIPLLIVDLEALEMEEDFSREPGLWRNDAFADDRAALIAVDISQLHVAGEMWPDTLVGDDVVDALGLEPRTR